MFYFYLSVQNIDIRQNTTEWVYSFLLLAYEPLEDADLETYIAFSETGAGQDLNAAMFAAFDGMSYRESLRFLIKRLPSWEGRGD